MNDIKVPTWKKQSDAAKKHIEKLFDVYCSYQCGATPDKCLCLDMNCTRMLSNWEAEYKFDDKRKWRFDYAVPNLKYAIEIDGGTFMGKSGHNSGVGLRGWREKNNAAMSAGWRVWHYAPEEIIKAGRKTMPDEPILKELPWLQKTARQRRLEDELV